MVGGASLLTEVHKCWTVGSENTGSTMYTIGANLIAGWLLEYSCLTYPQNQQPQPFNFYHPSNNKLITEVQARKKKTSLSDHSTHQDLALDVRE